jgi:cell division protein FtsI (penicillin-binding protein 3)
VARRGARPAVRLFSILGAVCLALVVISGRLVQLQVVKASTFENLGAKQRIRRVELPARRGTIYDRKGRPLAMSVEARAVYANPSFVSDKPGTAKAIGATLGIEPALIQERLERTAGFVYLARKVQVEAAEELMELSLPGIGTLEETKRVYPQGAVAGQVVGFVGTDNQGLAGIEAGLEKVLAGTPGEEIIEQDPRGRPIPNGRSSYRRPVPGSDIVLTIDRDLQFAAERALVRAASKTGARNGSALVLDPHSGEVLAMASWPPLDPGRFAGAPREAIRNRPVQDAYEPGSVNKVVTAAAALESGIVRPFDVLSIPNGLRIADKTFHDFKPHETWNITYTEALTRSSNIGTIEVALKIGSKRLSDMIEKFGLGEKTGIEFPGESAGITLPLEEWYPTSIGTIPIGQGIAVTPLQMAAVYATVANDGVWTQPRLIRSIEDRDGRRRGPRPPVHRRVVSAYTAAQLRAMLVNVVENGTGRNARIPGYLIGGKTGTARKPLEGARGYSSDVVTTFIGMVPIDHPRFVVGVVLDDPGVHLSAVTAAPAFKELISFALAHDAIPPSVALPADGATPAGRRR